MRRGFEKEGKFEGERENEGIRDLIREQAERAVKGIKRGEASGIDEICGDTFKEL